MAIWSVSDREKRQARRQVVSTIEESLEDGSLCELRFKHVEVNRSRCRDIASSLSLRLKEWRPILSANISHHAPTSHAHDQGHASFVTHVTAKRSKSRMRQTVPTSRRPYIGSYRCDIRVSTQTDLRETTPFVDSPEE